MPAVSYVVYGMAAYTVLSILFESICVSWSFLSIIQFNAVAAGGGAAIVLKVNSGKTILLEQRFLSKCWNEVASKWVFIYLKKEEKEKKKKKEDKI